MCYVSPNPIYLFIKAGVTTTTIGVTGTGTSALQASATASEQNSST